MKEENLRAVEALREKIRAKEEEARQLKIVVNSFYTDEGESAPYPNAHVRTESSLGSLRTDHFYGKTIAQAANLYLEMRKSSGLGSASVNDIYAALRAGGYAFEAKNEEYAKNGLRIALRKNPSIFHQLPNNDYGLSEWYPKKAQTTEEKPKKPGKKEKKAHKGIKKPEPITKPEPNGPTLIYPNWNAQQFEAFVRQKNRHLSDIINHFGINEATVTSLLEPKSRVYLAERGWFKIREAQQEPEKNLPRSSST